MSKYNGIDNASLLHPLWLVSWVSSVSQSPVSAPSRCLRAAAELGAGEPRATATTITASTFLCSLHQTDNSSADTQSRARPLSFVAGIEAEYLIHTMHCGPRGSSRQSQLYEHLFCMFWASNYRPTTGHNLVRSDLDFLLNSTPF